MKGKNDARRLNEEEPEDSEEEETRRRMKKNGQEVKKVKNEGKKKIRPECHRRTLTRSMRNDKARQLGA